jgi:hypothetical protein
MRLIDSDVIIWNWRGHETVIEHKLAVVTSSIKHFQAVKTLKIEAFRPL